MLISVTGVIGYSFQQQSLGLARCSADVMTVLTAGERWRADVRSATAPPRLDGGELVIPQSAGDIRYRFAGGEVQRRHENEWLPFLKNVQTSSTILDKGRYADGWRWEVELKASRPEPGLRPLFTFKVAAAHEQAKEVPLEKQP
jgi:hypothetical protein